MHIIQRNNSVQNGEAT